MFSDVRKNLIRALCRSTLFDWGVRVADFVPVRQVPLLRVLTYHRIDEVASRSDLDPSLISATPEQFASQIAWLSREYDLVSLDDVLAAVGEQGTLPRRALLLTFDDAYLDFEEHAWPILRQRAAPATLFVPTGFPDQPKRAFWWDRLYCALMCSEDTDHIDTPMGRYLLPNPAVRESVFHSLKPQLKLLPGWQMEHVVDSIREQCRAPHPKPSVMGWAQLQRLAKAGVALVPHTHTHPLLDRIPREDARREICLSRQVLQEKIGDVRPVFTYPSGHFDDQVATIVREEGFQLAFTTITGVNDLKSFDPVKLRRITVNRHKPDALLRFQLSAASRFLNPTMPNSYAKPLTQVAKHFEGANSANKRSWRTPTIPPSELPCTIESECRED